MRAQCLVLVGAGIAHRAVLKYFTEFEDMSHVEVLLVSPEPPTIDFSKQTDFRVSYKQERCLGFDPLTQKLSLEKSGLVHYDYICFETGSDDQVKSYFKAVDLAGPSGCLEVIGALHTPIFSNVFGVGDCIDFRPAAPKGLPKNDVETAAQIPILCENLMRSVQGRYDYKSYRPRRSFLSLLGLSR